MLSQVLQNVLGTDDLDVDPRVPIDAQPCIVPYAERLLAAKRQLGEVTPHYQWCLGRIDPHRRPYLPGAPVPPQEIWKAEQEFPEAKKHFFCAQAETEAAQCAYDAIVRRVRKVLASQADRAAVPVVRALYAKLDEAKVANDAVLASEAHARTLIARTPLEQSEDPFFMARERNEIRLHWLELVNDPLVNGGVLEHRRRILIENGYLG